MGQSCYAFTNLKITWEHLLCSYMDKMVPSMVLAQVRACNIWGACVAMGSVDGMPWLGMVRKDSWIV